MATSTSSSSARDGHVDISTLSPIKDVSIVSGSTKTLSATAERQGSIQVKFAPNAADADRAVSSGKSVPVKFRVPRQFLSPVQTPKPKPNDPPRQPEKRVDRTTFWELPLGSPILSYMEEFVEHLQRLLFESAEFMQAFKVLVSTCTKPGNPHKMKADAITNDVLNNADRDFAFLKFKEYVPCTLVRKSEGYAPSVALTVSQANPVVKAPGTQFYNILNKTTIPPSKLDKHSMIANITWAAGTLSVTMLYGAKVYTSLYTAEIIALVNRSEQLVEQACDNAVNGMDKDELESLRKNLESLGQTLSPSTPAMRAAAAAKGLEIVSDSEPLVVEEFTAAADPSAADTVEVVDTPPTKKSKSKSKKSSKRKSVSVEVDSDDE